MISMKLVSALWLFSACGAANAAPGPVGPAPAVPAVPTSSSAPASVANAPAAAPAAVVQLAAGGDVTCSRHADGSVRCWGDNYFNVISPQFAPLGETAMARPTPVSNLPPAAQIVLGDSYGCARLGDGSVRCWGTDAGDLGLGTPVPPGPPPHTEAPMPVLGLGGVQSLSGFGHLCASLADRSVRCWADYDGGNGDPRDSGSRVPVVVPEFAGALQLADGGDHSCARLATQVKCWRDISPGRVPKGKVRAPAYVVNVRNVASIAAGHYGGCALLNDGGVSCWGQSPFLSSADRVNARPVAALRGAVALALSNGLGCALMAGGKVLCRNEAEAALAPVVGLDGAVEIAVGSDHGCARTQDARVFCWGHNDKGQLGIGTTTVRAGAAPIVW